MKVTPVKGTNDYLPQETALRDYLQSVILRTYENSGFQRITTPVVEDMENLKKSDGGENLNLIFEIMKRGDKLKKSLEQQDYDNLADLGLRYDLTLPLSRYYANNRANLALPFKVIQMDRVYRAERPQKGRLREFVQCDIDILGSSSMDCEIELIHITAKALLAIGLDNFKIKINNRQLLKSVLLGLGFTDDQLDSVCVSFDKLDKIGVDGVQKELEAKDFAADAVANFVDMLGKMPLSLEQVKELAKDTQPVEELEQIIAAAKQLSGGTYDIEYDISLVRGQGYYTGTIFEVESLDFKGSVAGGGRYDQLIGKFLNEQVPAVGFSIGFERIFSILREKNYRIPDRKKKVALLYNSDAFIAAIEKAEELRGEYDVSLFVNPKKTGKFLNKLEAQGFDGFVIPERSDELKWFEE